MTSIYEIGNERTRNNRYPWYCDICNAAASNDCICNKNSCNQCDNYEHSDIFFEYLEMSLLLPGLNHIELQRLDLEGADIN